MLLRADHLLQNVVLGAIPFYSTLDELKKLVGSSSVCLNACQNTSCMNRGQGTANWPFACISVQVCLKDLLALIPYFRQTLILSYRAFRQ